MNRCSCMGTGHRDQAGFSLVELMIAITIGLILVAGLTTLFVSNSRARSETELSNRQLENGRYATSVISEDLRLAGYYGEFDPTPLVTPTSMPDPCLTSVSDLKAAMPLHIQGYDNDAGVPSLSCITDRRSDTDVIVLRRVSTCIAGSTDCESVNANIPYFQASRCGSPTELASGDINKFYGLDTNISNLSLHKRDCTNLADLRRYRTHIYFIANNAIGSDGVPTLKRAELATSGGTTAFTIVPIAEGVENMQLEYGMDTDNNGAPDIFTTSPSTYNSCAGAACVNNMRNVVAVRLSLLARNTRGSPGHVDSKSYVLGVKDDGTPNTISAYNDNIKRHAYQTSIRLTNPAGRRE